MILSLKYGDLTTAISQTNKLANELDQYSNDLSNKVQQKMYSVEGGMNSRISSADYYVKSKISQIRTRQRNATALASTIQTLHDTAKRVDEDVKRTIESNQMAFFKKNPDLKAPWYQQAWTSFMCDMKKIPILGSLIKGGKDELSAMDELWNNMRYWYKCGGGEKLLTNLLDIGLKIGAAVAAVALLIGTIAAGGALAVIIGLAILAVIAVVNAGMNIYTSIKAIRENDPAMSKIYSQQDSLKQYLQETNFHNKQNNRWSEYGASFITGLEVVANVLIITGSLPEINLTKLKQSGNWIFRNKDFADFKLSLKDGPLSLWNGVRTVGIKVYRGIPEILEGGFSLGTISKVFNGWEIVQVPVNFTEGINDLYKVLKGNFTQEHQHWNNKIQFFKTSDALDKLQLLKTLPKPPGILTQPCLPKFTPVFPKFEFQFPYLGVAA